MECYRCGKEVEVDDYIKYLPNALPTCDECIEKSFHEHINTPCEICGELIGEEEWDYIQVSDERILAKIHRKCLTD